MAETQNYKNHARFHVPFHFVLAPLALIYLIYTVVRLFQEPSVDRAAAILLALIVIGALSLARLNALRVQDRVIRLEEQLRLRRLLSPDLAFQAENLPTSQLIALRFASDAELPEMVTRILGGELSQPKQIKESVKDWRGDYSRV